MSVEEYKQRLHEVIDGADDESALRTLLDTANRVLGSRDILDDLTEEQLAGLMEANKQVEAGNYITLDEFKRRFEQRWQTKKR